MPKHLEIPDELVQQVAFALRNHSVYLSGYLNDSRFKDGLAELIEQLESQKKPAKSAGSAVAKRKAG